jgi:hypothetical protein
MAQDFCPAARREKGAHIQDMQPISQRGKRAKEQAKWRGYS